ncbi:MAG TPA: Calx-beta domain-containing protein [Pyrinomonadaceae bacterium]|jgi:hypothetical protein|nr:Calx-beta domain-containing protein [Pyrinomonadaceae bacterium]
MNRYHAKDVILRANLSLLLLLCAASSVIAQRLTLVSINDNTFKTGNGATSAFAASSADGRFIVFASTASDLVANDTNGLEDVFVRDTQVNKTTLVSINSAGTNGGNGNSDLPAISADGRFVAFASQATDLVATATGGIQNVFVRDLQTGVTTLVSINSSGTGGGNLVSDFHAISANGQVVIYRSAASNLVANDTNGATDIFARHLLTNTTFLLSINQAGTASGNGPSSGMTISADARFVAFGSRASDLVATDTNGVNDVFVRDLQTGTTRLVSINSAGTNSGNKASDVPIISADGHVVAFDSSANNLVLNDNNGFDDVYVRNLIENKTTLVSVNNAGTSSINGDSYISTLRTISADGNIIAFRSRASNLVSKDTNGEADVFARDLSTGKTTLVSASSIVGRDSGHGSSDGAGDFSLAVSPNGRFVAFDSSADDLVSNDFVLYDNNQMQDTFTRDLQTGRTRLINSGNNGSGNGASFLTSVIDDGTTIFITLASDLGYSDTNASEDIFSSLAIHTINNFQFFAPVYTVNENSATATITVLRDSSGGSASVDYIASDGTALQRSDYTIASGTLNFAPGEYSKTFNVLITNNAYVDGTRTLNLKLSNPTGQEAKLAAPASALLIITDNDTAQPTTNPIDETTFFVRQQYADFLNRAPDAGGLAFWSNEINKCGSDAQCIHDRRVGVADAFFFEDEFQKTGAYIYRVYKAAFGARPTYAQFSSDRGRVVVGPGLDQSKTAFALTLVQRNTFIALYPRSMTADQFVDALLNSIKQHSGVDLSSQRGALMSLYDGTDNGRAAILKQIVETQSFIDAEYNQAFVLMEYFGYLRREADQGGYDFWLAQVNKFPLRNVGIQHAMACSFITSAEYQTRFSPVVTHSNRECPQ